MHKRVRFIAVAFGAACLAVAPAGATTITTTCYNTGTCMNGLWDSAAFISGSPTEINLPSITTGPYSGGTAALPAKLHPSVIFTFTGNGLTGNASTGELFAPSMDITTPTGGETAMIVYIISSGTITVKPSDGTVSLTGASGWFGFSASHALTSLDITTTGGQVTMADFFYGTSSLPPDSPAPEAGTLLLTCGGLLVLLGSGRKLSQRFAA